MMDKALVFLNKLKLNNNRDWFNAHKDEYQSIQKEIKKFYEDIKLNLEQEDLKLITKDVAETLKFSNQNRTSEKIENINDGI